MASPKLRFSVSPPTLKVKGRNAVRILGEGYFYSLSFADNVLPGTVFHEDGLVTGVYVNTSDIVRYFRARIIDLAKTFPGNIVSEAPDVYWLDKYGEKQFSLPPWGVPGGATAGPMPNSDWTLQLQLLGYV